MMLVVPPFGPIHLRMPKLRLEPTPLQELRDLVDLVAFEVAWRLVRVGFALSRRFEPCDVCPRCGPYPVIGREGKCAECGSALFNTGDTGEFR